ncbi:MAG: glycosyltransferase family 4 protein [Vicinamibacterales bacterium]
MRILLLTESIPYPLDSGGRIKTFNTLRMLGTQHALHLHAFIREARQRTYESALRPFVQDVTLHLLPRSIVREASYGLAALVSGTPYTVRRHFDAAVLARVTADFERLHCDAIYCDHLSMAEYGRRLGVPMIIDAHNVEYEILRRYAKGHHRLSPIRLALEREWRAIRAYETHVYEAARLVFAVSDEDASAIRQMAPATRLAVAAIAVDTGAIAPVVGPAVGADLLFVGGLHWPPNVEAVAFFLNDVWTQVLRQRPDARFTVVGRPAPVGRLRQDLPGVTFAGYVDDVKPFYDRRPIVVAPILSGSGLRVKILDAMAHALPVVSTTIGCEGIGARHGQDILIADTADAFAANVVALLNDRQRAQDLGHAGRSVVEQRFSLDAVGIQMREAIEGL